MEFSHNYWDENCEGQFYIGWARSAKIVNNTIKGKGASALLAYNCYAVENVSYIGNNIDGTFRGPTAGAYSRNVVIKGNQIKNVPDKAISLDARIGHVVSNNLTPNIIGSWDASTGVLPNFPSAVTDDAVIVTKGANFLMPDGNYYEFRKGDIVFYSSTNTSFGSNWFVDYPYVDGVIEGNVIKDSGQIYIQGSDVKIEQNIFHGGSIRVNGGQRIRINGNQFYTNFSGIAGNFITLNTGATVTIGKNTYRNNDHDGDLADVVTLLTTQCKVYYDNARVFEGVADGDYYLTWDDEQVICNNGATNLSLRLPAENTTQNHYKTFHIHNLGTGRVALKTRSGYGTIDGSTGQVNIPGKHTLLVVRAGADDWKLFWLKTTTYRQNAGTPVGVILPNFIGEELFDSTNLHWYKSVGWLNTDWKQTTN
jgi:hypothetical protein